MMHHHRLRNSEAVPNERQELTRQLSVVRIGKTACRVQEPAQFVVIRRDSTDSLTIRARLRRQDRHGHGSSPVDADNDKTSKASPSSPASGTITPTSPDVAPTYSTIVHQVVVG
jgi:hypothetical protein